LKERKTLDVRHPNFQGRDSTTLHPQVKTLNQAKVLRSLGLLKQTIHKHRNLEDIKRQSPSPRESGIESTSKAETC